MPSGSFHVHPALRSAWKSGVRLREPGFEHPIGRNAPPLPFPGVALLGLAPQLIDAPLRFLRPPLQPRIPAGEARPSSRGSLLAFAAQPGGDRMRRRFSVPVLLISLLFVIGDLQAMTAGQQSSLDQVLERASASLL